MRYDDRILAAERARTNPDYVLFTPRFREYETDNVHLHVFHHERFGGMIAIWTQSSVECFGDNHLVISYSRDDGVTWTEPRYIAGAVGTQNTVGTQASWAMPVVSASGRIYLFYFRETDFVDNGRQITGEFVCIVSDDCGETWTEPVPVPMRMTPYDVGPIQNNCIFEMGIRLKNGSVLFGYTKWTSYRICPPNGKWYEDDARLYFMRLDNIDEDPDPADLAVTFLPDDEHGVGIPLGDGIRSCAQEPSLVYLPDGRLFCTFRTALGYPAWTCSSDEGHTWTEPEAIRYDDGTPLVHPLSPCPVYCTGEGEYLFLFHNQAEDIGESRNTVYRITGHFDPEARQPVVFRAGTERLWMEVPPERGPLDIRFDLALYGSVTHTGGKMILWYPERKFFLLGKVID